MVNFISFIKFADDIENDRFSDIVEDMFNSTNSAKKVLALYTTIIGLQQFGYKFTPTSFNKSLPSIPLMEKFVNPAYDYFKNEILNNPEKLNEFLNQFMMQYYGNLVDNKTVLRNSTIRLSTKRNQDNTEIKRFKDTGTVYLPIYMCQGKPLIEIGFSQQIGKDKNNNPINQFVKYWMIRTGDISENGKKIKYTLIAKKGITVRGSGTYINLQQYNEYAENNELLNPETVESSIGEVRPVLPQYYPQNQEIDNEEDNMSNDLSYEANKDILEKNNIDEETWNSFSNEVKQNNLKCYN